MAPVSQTYGALLIGGMLAFYLSGIVSTQAFLYFRTFPQDRPRVKVLVLAVWFLDVLHSAFVCATVWYYLVTGLGNISALSRVHWSVGVTITITGVITFVIHCFFAYRVWTLSRRNIWITSVIVILSFLRTLSAFGTVIQLSRLHTWAHFHEVAAWSFTTGLVISACVDLLIAISIVYYLKKNRTGFERMDYIIDTIMVYTVENGMLTSLSVVASFICWLTMPHNFIFLALHFVITKMYANSLLATLNARKHIKDRSCHTNSHWRDNSARLPALATNQSMRLTDTVRVYSHPRHIIH
ncbi:hypothetical protein BC629DRAFT_690805 [Irpex lacteus]|nr:hypothetical protein BC629DRAFT_690805 [Irpex lacteus]